MSINRTGSFHQLLLNLKLAVKSWMAYLVLIINACKYWQHLERSVMIDPEDMQIVSALPVFNFSLKIVINTAYQLYLKLFPLHLIPISWQIFILLTHYVAMYTSERSANFSNGYEGSTFSPIWKALKLKNQKQRWKYETTFYTRPIYPEEYCSTVTHFVN